MKVAVYRKAHFNAAHRLYNKSWSQEKNDKVFGLCNNANWHGHNYELLVKVIGEINPDTGYVIDLKVLKDIIKEEVEERFDHKNLNLDCPEFENLNPSAENIAVVIYDLLRGRLDKCFEIQVRLYETERNFVEYPV
ncbi:MAG: 6-carboxytetrahydropterin synthase [Chitinophagales bacterium]|jgi:6-pyruvoyltetrahydropterin/6-carboxytetrahydropterin synthase|nr:6-carboxytetrahydropterin synthase [Chitinophagales bacterium]|tara:strand:+ start:2648 stop:3055 length:408 start_codon:yes stop_codon:yes gene_type:complete